MDWIIMHSNKMEFHTHLNVLFEPIYDIIDNYNWLVSDIEHGGTDNYNNYNDLPINHHDEYFILSPERFKTLLDIDVQIWWGVISGIPINKTVVVDDDNLPFSEGNELIWSNGNIQHPDAEIEIICWDSSRTIVKFRDKAISDRFKAYFDQAFELEKLSEKIKNRGY